MCALKQKIKFSLLGFIAGILNGIFGAGGGLLVVPMLEAQGIEPKKAHATSIAIILPLSIISAVMYFLNGVQMDLPTLWIVVPLGILGAVAGSFLLMKMKNKLLKKLFGVVMIVSAVRILLR